MAAMVARSFSSMNLPRKSPVTNEEPLTDTRHKINIDMIETAADQSDTSPDCVRWMAEHVPVFGISGHKVTIIQEPSQFYDALMKGALTAKKRIVLASLYLGTGKLEKELVDCIHTSLSRAKTSGQPLNVDILLDYTRGCRGTENSCTMLLPLLTDFSDNVRVALYHTPDLRGLLKRIVPERYNETVGLSHMKVYIFDDTVIMSGANLSDNYFTNRQDRYMVIHDCPDIAEYYSKLVGAVSSFSFQLNKDQTFSLASDFNIHPYQDNDNGSRFKEEARKRILEVIAPNGNRSDNKVNDYHNTDSNIDSEPEIDTWVYALTQMGPLNITIDDQMTQQFFTSVDKGSNVFLASGYFNLTDRYMDVIIANSKAQYEILSASPQVNGFYGAAGFAGSIPDAYTYISKLFRDRVLSAGQNDRINLYEFTRDKWTFHAKGLWYYLPGHKLPVLTFIGSPNFGYRSVYRDLENQIVIATKNRHLQEQLHQEKKNLYARSYTVDDSVFDRPERQVALWVKWVTSVIRHFF